jgi:hypothetical protein
VSHTPGPWTLDVDGTVALSIRPPYGRVDTDEVATVWFHGRCLAICPGDDAETFANARLIAAAPDMLALLQEYSARDGQIEGASALSLIARTRRVLEQVEGAS